MNHLDVQMLYEEVNVDVKPIWLQMKCKIMYDIEILVTRNTRHFQIKLSMMIATFVKQ